MKIIKGRRFVLAEDFLVGGSVAIEKNAVVEILENEDENAKSAFVQDLSAEKHDDGRWYVPISMLKPAQAFDTPPFTKKACSGNCVTCRGQTKDKFYDAHYANMIGLEPIELMQLVLTSDEFIGFLKGNIIKYTLRAGHKQGEAAEKDIAKAKRYKQWLLQVGYYCKDNMIHPKED